MEQEWIDKNKRMPDRKDGKRHNGCVLAWHRYQGASVVLADRVRDNDYFTHWMPLPPKPDRSVEDIRRPAYLDDNKDRRIIMDDD